MASALEQLSAQAAANVAPALPRSARSSARCAAWRKQPCCRPGQPAHVAVAGAVLYLPLLTGDPDDSIAWRWRRRSGVLLTHGQLCRAIAGKWLVLGRFQPGRYPLWGVTYFRWWLADRLADVPATYLLHGLPLLTAYWRAMGARIGRIP